MPESRDTWSWWPWTWTFGERLWILAVLVVLLVVVGAIIQALA